MFQQSSQSPGSRRHPGCQSIPESLAAESLHDRRPPAEAVRFKPVCIAPTGAASTRYGETPAFAEGLYRVAEDAYAWMVPNGSWGEANSGLIAGRGRTLLIDTLYDGAHTRRMLNCMTAAAGPAPDVVVNTHADGDHWWGNSVLKEAEIIASQAARDEMGSVKPAAMIWLGRVGRMLSALGFRSAREIGHWLEGCVAPYDFRGVERVLPTRTFRGELALDVGGREVRLIEVGAAHTRGDVMVYLPDARLLYAGDVVMHRSTPMLWNNSPKKWMAALDRILDMDVDTIVPGHGPITDKSAVLELKAYWRRLIDRVPGCFAAGRLPRHAAAEIVLSPDFAVQPFSRWNSPERTLANVYMMYRELQGQHGDLGLLEQFRVMIGMAMLAHKLPQAEPRSLRLPA